MDIKAINENIEELENSDTTFDNVKELAYLYIVRDHMFPQDKVEVELSDILPAYSKYVAIKYRYQRHEITEEPVVSAITEVCREIKEFLQTLYSGTDMHKERVQIIQMLSALNEQYNK